MSGSPIILTFTKDKVWNRFVRFDIDKNSLKALDIEPTETKPKNKKGSSGFSQINRNFTTVHETFFLHFPLQSLISELHVNQLIDHKLRTYCIKHGIRTDQSEKQEKYSLDSAHLLGFSEILSEITPALRTVSITTNNFIMQLCSQFDVLVSSIIAEMIKAKPELLDSSDRKIEYTDLYAFKTIEDVRSHFSEKFVEGIIRRSRREQFQWFSNVLKIPMTEGLMNWPAFVEVNERRNLLTHTGGIVSTEYLNNCKEVNFKLDAHVKVGGQLRTSLGYFRDATEIFFEIGVKLIQVIWRKMLPDEIEEADNALIAIGYDLILNKKYKLASEILRFSCDVLKNVKSERSRRILLVNYANCFSLQGKREAANNILSRVDWSAADAQFQVCLSAVKGDFAGLVSQMKKMGPEGEINEREYREWPVFRLAHKEESFKECYRSLFGKELMPSVPAKRLNMGALRDSLDEFKKHISMDKDLVEQTIEM